MNFIKRIAAIVVVTLAVVGTAFPAHAADTVPWPGEPVTDCQADIDALELRVATLEGTLAQERDEHADALRTLDERAWATQQAHDAEVNELSAAVGDSEVVVRGLRAELAASDLHAIRLQARVERLRAKLQAARQ